MSDRKQELIDAIIDYLARHGLSDLSLRPLASEIGTSARLLIFHFQSKEQLLTEVLEEMQERLQRSLAALHAGKPESAQAPLLKVFWAWAIHPKNYDYLRLHYQLHLLATQSPGPYGRYLKQNSRNWLQTIQAVLPPPKRTPAFATLLGAVFDGLFIELMSTGDKKRTTQALDRFIELARQEPPAPKRPPR